MNITRFARSSRSLNTVVAGVAGSWMLALASLSANAANVSVFNTGVDATGAKLAVGSVDPHWQLAAGPGVTAPVSAVVVNNQHPFGQYFATADSTWIFGVANAAATVGVPYTFRLQFDLNGFDPSTATMTGSWGVDNHGDILLNGAAAIGTGIFSLAGNDPANYNLLHGFAITGGFVSGINSLEFQVIDGGNPAGLNVTGLAGAAALVPEPETYYFMLTGLGMLGLVARRRKATLHALAS